jgi:hypothetical protein
MTFSARRSIAASVIRRDLGQTADLAASLVVVLLSVIVCIAYQSLFIRADTSMSVDEGYMGGVAARMATTHFLPYVDAATQRGPVQYWLVTLAQSLSGGVFEWRGFRFLGIATSAGTALICWALGVQLGRPFAGAVAGAIYVFALYFLFDVGAGIGVNGEHMANPFICGGVLCAVLAHTRREQGRSFKGWYFVGGFLTALAGFTKQSILVQVLPVALWLGALALLDRSTSLRQRWAPIALYIGGWAAAVGVMLAPYAATGQLGTFFYWFITYNANVHMGPYRSAPVAQAIEHFGIDQPYAVFPILLGLAVGVPASATRLYALAKGTLPTAKLGFEVVIALQAMLTLLFAMLQLRFWPHHFTAFVPWLGLLLGIQFDAALRASDFQRFAYGAAALGFIVMFGCPLAWRFSGFAKQRAHGGWEGSRADPVCQEIQKYSTAGEGLFVWGFAGDLYVSCRRRPASRYTYSIAVAGIVPPFWGEPREDRVARNAVSDVLSDLQSERPPVIVDVPISGFSITRIADFKKLLEHDYCGVAHLAGHGADKITVYARRDRGACG